VLGVPSVQFWLRAIAMLKTAAARDDIDVMASKKSMVPANTGSLGTRALLDDGGPLASEFWNNAKGLLMFIVMGLHFVQLGPDMTMASGGFLSRLMSPFLIVGTAVAMPANSFISGRFSSANFGRGHARRQVSLFAVYIITHLIWMPMSKNQSVYFPNSTHHFFWIYSYDWYLLALFVWRTMLPILAELEPPVIAVCSMTLAIAALFLDWSEVTNEQLVLSFLPFFLAGFHFKKMDGCLRKWRQRRWPLWFGMLAVALVSSISFFYVPFTDAFNRAYICLYGGWARDVRFWSIDNPGSTYEAIQNRSIELPHSADCRAPHMLVQILGLYVMSAVSLTLLLAMVPERPIPLLTMAGKNSLYMYILHFYVVILFSALANDFDPNIRTALAISIWFALWAFLASGRINKLFWLCVEPPVDFLMRTEEA